MLAFSYLNLIINKVYFKTAPSLLACGKVVTWKSCSEVSSKLLAAKFRETEQPFLYHPFFTAMPLNESFLLIVVHRAVAVC